MKCYIDNCVHLRSCIRDINIELYPFLAVSKMPEISRRVSHLVTKTYIFYEKSQNNATPPSVTSKQKLRRSTRKPLKLMESTKKFH
jgi:hypothetical protein